jgi:hypothetical protein
VAAETERELNASLRLVDWRFLLPSPRPHRALCRCGSALADAVARIAREVVPASAGADCDLAVAENPDARTLAELRAALHPGGVCYTEWHPRIGGASRVERELRTAGFEHVTCYHRWPVSASLPVYWIPVGESAPAAYVRARGRLRGGRLRRLLADVGGAVRGLFLGHIGRPISAVARTAPEPSVRESDPAAWLREHWSAWGLGTAPERLSTLLVTGGPRSVSKVVLLAFAEPVGVPLAAIKAPRVGQAASGIRREGQVLERLAARGRATSGVPRFLALREHDGVPTLSESALDGRPLESLLTQRNLESWSTKVADFLARLRQDSVRPAAAWREAVVEPALSRFVGAFGGVVDPGLLREGEAIVRGIGALPVMAEQRDFGPWNVLVTPGGGIAALDWESAEEDGLPALDLLYYLAYASFSVDRAWSRESRIASYRRALDSSTRTGGVRQRSLARYLDALGLGPVSLAPLRALVWIIHAESDFRHAVADAGGAPPVDELARSLFLALWTEEVRHLTASR